MTDDHNPTRPTPHGAPDRRYVDRSPPRQSERIPPAELAKLVEGFVPEYCRRVGIKQPKPKQTSAEPDSFERRMGELPGIIERCPNPLDYQRTEPDAEGDDF